MPVIHRKIAEALIGSLTPGSLQYYYSGQINEEISSNLLQLSEQLLENDQTPNKLKKRVFFLLVESMQNITRHQNPPAVSGVKQNAFMALQKFEDKIFITSGNWAISTAADKFQKQIENINKLSPEEIKAFALQQLEEGEFSDAGGAGLGIIEMARKSGNKLGYVKGSTIDGHTYIYFQTLVSEKSLEALPEGQLQTIAELHQQLGEDNVGMAFAGDFSQELVKSIVSMLEQELTKQDMATRKKVLLVTIEMLQNITRHVTGTTSGVLLVSSRPDGYVITTVNAVAKEKVEELKERMDTANTMNQDELESLYNKVIMHDNNKYPGLGLIDIRLKSGDKLNYEFTPDNLLILTTKV